VPEAAAPVAAPAPAPVAAAPPAPAPAPARATVSILPWLLGALLLIGLAVFFMRRRRIETIETDESYAPAVEPVAAAPVMAEPFEPVVAPPAIAPLAAAPAERGRPWIELLMRPVRAGVEDTDAVVEFELTVDNQGSAPARDVRVSTWMVAAGASSEMERALIEGDDSKTASAGTIDSGDSQRIERKVALPTDGLAEDSVLPVVVAEARYTLPDGSEARTSAAFEVGVPYEGELAHFAIDNPSGLHDDVEARVHGEPEHA
jgi:hypothetical protein